MRKLKEIIFGKPTVEEFWQNPEIVKNFKKHYKDKYLECCEEFLDKIENTLKTKNTDLCLKIRVSHYEWTMTGAEVFEVKLKKEVADQVMRETRWEFLENYSDTKRKIFEI